MYNRLLSCTYKPIPEYVLMHYMNYYYYFYVRQGMIFRSIQLGKLIFRLNTKRIVLVLLAHLQQDKCKIVKKMTLDIR